MSPVWFESGAGLVVVSNMTDSSPKIPIVSPARTQRNTLQPFLDATIPQNIGQKMNHKTNTSSIVSAPVAHWRFPAGSGVLLLRTGGYGLFPKRLAYQYSVFVYDKACGGQSLRSELFYLFVQSELPTNSQPFHFSTTWRESRQSLKTRLIELEVGSIMTWSISIL